MHSVVIVGVCCYMCAMIDVCQPGSRQQCTQVLTDLCGWPPSSKLLLFLLAPLSQLLSRVVCQKLKPVGKLYFRPIHAASVKYTAGWAER